MEIHAIADAKGRLHFPEILEIQVRREAAPAVTSGPR